MSVRTILSLLLILLQLASPLAIAEQRALPGVTPEEIKKAEALKSTKLEQYFVQGFTGDTLPQALHEDVLLLIRKGAELGVFPAGFEKWWGERKLTPRLLREFKDMTVSEFVAAMYAKYLDETAQKLDDADPKTAEKKKNGQPTDGDNWLVHMARKASDNPWISTVTVGIAGAVFWVAKNVFDTLWHGFVAGPIAATLNTGSEPLSKPVQDYIRQQVNKRLAQRTWVRKWTIWWTGEESKRKAAAKAKADGQQITGDAAHYDMPGVEVEDFAKDTRIFFEEMLAADLKWRGWTLDEVARARQTGFMILFEQPRLIGEQIMGAQSRIDIVKIRQQLEYAPPLLNHGATPEELLEFNKLLEQIHRLKKFKSPTDPAIAPLEEKVVAISQAWITRGVKREHIEAFRESEKHHLVAKDRTAFVMASVLYSELYFQEYNRALGNLHQLQQWQELSREMTGFYEALEEHREAIEMYFQKKGMKYDVQKRIDERGYPLGGPRRPDNVPPLRDRLDAFFRTGVLPPEGGVGPMSRPAGNGNTAPGEATAPREIPVYNSRADFERDMQNTAQTLNALLERSLTSGPDPLLDITIEATLDAAYTKIAGAPPSWRDYARAFWLELKERRFPRINERIEKMRAVGGLHSQVDAGVKLEKAIGKDLYAVNCVLRYRNLKPLPRLGETTAAAAAP